MAEPRDGVPRDGVPRDGAHGDPDPELSLSGIVWSALGVVGVTAVSMIVVWWLGGGLISKIDKAQGSLTPAEVREAELTRQAGEERLQSGEKPDLPGLALPADYALPPGPQLETTPTGDIGRLRLRESEILERWGWADEAAGTVHVPIDEAIGLAVSGGLPGIRLDGSAGGETADAGAAGTAAGTAAEPAAEAGSAGEEVRDAT